MKERCVPSRADGTKSILAGVPFLASSRSASTRKSPNRPSRLCSEKDSSLQSSGAPLLFAHKSRKEQSHFHCLLIVESRVQLRPVITPKVGLGHPACYSDALCDVLTG